MNNNELPEIPKKLPWWKALWMGMEKVNQMIEALTKANEEYNARNEEWTRNVGEWEQKKGEEKKEIETKRDEIIRAATAKMKEAEEILEAAKGEKKVAEDELRLAEELRNEAAEKLKELNRKIEEAEQARRQAEQAKADADEAKKQYREENGIRPEIPDEAVKRDLIIKTSLRAIQNQVQAHGERIVANKGIEQNGADIAIINKEKATLKAELLAVICAYRDALPEQERAGFLIDGKGVSAFLQDLARQIVEDSKTGKNLVYLNNNPLEHTAVTAIDKTYKTVAKNGMLCDAERAYPKAAYGPFDTRLELTDHRGVAFNVFENCFNGKEVGLELTGGCAGLPRTTTNKGEVTDLEAGIQEVVTEVDDWER